MGKKVDRFEDLECWKSARELVKIVLVHGTKGKLERDFEVRSQLIRAALSTMNNIAEGFGRHGDKEFVRFLDISQSSAIELKSMSYVLEDANYISLDQVQLLREQSEKTKALTLGLIRYLRTKH